jgi:allantoin racemase
MRIWFQKNVVAGRVPGLDAAYDAHMRAVLRSDTEVRFHHLPAETYEASLPEHYVRYGAVQSLFSSYFSLQAIRAERAGYDAFVIGTSQDPGLVEAKAWVDIPVLGFGETAAHVAALICQRFSFVGFIPELEAPITHNKRRAGLADRLSPFAFVAGGPDRVVAAFAGAPDPFVVAFHDAARTALAAGAEAIIPADGLTNEIVVAQGIRVVDGAPVIDACGLLVKMAEVAVDLQRLRILGKPGRGYYNQRPGPEHVEHLLKLFAPRSYDPI